MNGLLDRKTVHKLPEEVVRQISAGEVITRPVNCVKELIENSLDAKATNIQITVKKGGLDLIKVKDNGVGISISLNDEIFSKKRDLQIVCERYTTSKLNTFDDLASIESYGFRGEALYSMSSVGNLTITTKRHEDDIGSIVEYANGMPKTEIRPIAANNGTIITIEQLFYNVPSRRKHCEKSNVEYGLVTELVTKYAIHCSNSVAFNLRKDEKQCDISTSLGSQTMSNISSLYGYNVGKHLVAVCCDSCTEYSFSMTGVVSKPAFAVKKFEFILFINDRLVECRDLKKTIQNIYSNYLTKGFHPFVYLSLKLDSNLVDVNVHPSKNEVKYLHEDDINGLIVKSIEEKLKSSANASVVGSPLNNFTSLRTPPSSSKKITDDSPNEKVIKKTPKILRMDSRHRKLEQVFSQKSILDSSGQNIGRREISLTSVRQLREKVYKDVDPEVEKVITESEFVGCFNERAFLIQNGEKLLVVNYEKLSEQLFYQLYLNDFGNFGSIHLETPICIQELCNIYFTKFAFDLQREGVKTAEESRTLLVNKRVMLKDYFAIDIDSDGLLTGLPIILDGHLPDFTFLPEFMYNLVNSVNWDSEKECFHTVGLALSAFYSRPPKEADLEAESQWKQMVEYVVYMKAKEFLRPNTSLLSSFAEATNLSVLYRVFERC